MKTQPWLSLCLMVTGESTIFQRYFSVSRHQLTTGKKPLFGHITSDISQHFPWRTRLEPQIYWKISNMTVAPAILWGEIITTAREAFWAPRTSPLWLVTIISDLLRTGHMWITRCYPHRVLRHSGGSQTQIGSTCRNFSKTHVSSTQEGTADNWMWIQKAEESFLELEYKVETSVRSERTRKNVRRDFFDTMVVAKTNAWCKACPSTPKWCCRFTSWHNPKAS